MQQETSTKWQSMKTPPASEGLYLVNHQTRYSNAPWENRVIPARWINGRWMCYGTDHSLCELVTHWANIPDPPDQET